MMKKIVALAVVAFAFVGCQWCGLEPEPVKAALYVGKGALGVGEYGWLQIATFAEGMETTLVDADAIKNGALDKVELLIMPGGRSWRISDALGEDGRKKVEDFIRNGGGYVGTCAGAFLVSESSESHPKMMNLIPFTSRGGRSNADMMIRFSPRAAELAGIKAGRHRVKYAGGPVFEAAKPVADAEYEVIATYDSSINTWTDKEVPTMAGKGAVVAGRCGKGKIFASTVHPEADIDDHYIIEGAFRYLTGREIKWTLPQRRLGDLAVGIDMDKGFASLADAKLMQERLANARRDGLDFVPVNEDIHNEGVRRHLDVVVKPTADGFEKVAAVKALPPQAFGHVVDKPRDGLKKVKVAVYADKGGVNFSITDRLALSPEFDVKALSGKDIADGKLKGFDMLLQPGGWSPSQYAALGTNGCAAIDRFIRGGGSYYGLCAGAFLASETVCTNRMRASLIPWKDIDETTYRGWGPIKVKLTDEGAAALGLAVTNRYVTYWGGPAFLPGKPVAGADIRAWGNYFGRNLNTCTPDAIKPLGGTAAFLGGTLGKGKVFISGPHPEKDDRTYDIVNAAVKYLTGVKPNPVPNGRRRGALSVAMADTRDTASLDMFLNALIRDRRFDVRIKWSKNDLKHLDAIVIGSPGKDSFTASVEEFAANGGKVLAVVDTPNRLAAVEGKNWVIRVQSPADIPAELGKLVKDPLAGPCVASAVSPDGKNEIRLYSHPLAYDVRRNGETVVEKTPIDLEIAGKGLAADFVGAVAVTNLVRSGKVKTPVYKKAEVDLAANEAFADCGAWGVRLVARDDGVAYRFETKLGGEVTVSHERAGVNVGADALCHVPFTTGYGREQRHPETLKAADLHVFDAKKPKFAYLPFLCRTKGVTVAVAESDVCDYPVLNLARTSPTNTAGTIGMESVFARWPSKLVNNAGKDRTEDAMRQRHWLVRGCEDWLVKTAGTRTFPWRCFMMSEDYAKLCESDIVYALARPPAAKADFGWVKPGKVAWEWWNAFDNIGDPAVKGHTNGCTTATYKRFIDFAAKNGVEYVIMDEGWSKKLDIWQFSPDVDVPYLIKYAGGKGVGIILWMAWAQVEGQEAKVAEHFAKLGAKGFKVDFMDRGDAQVERFLWKFADECAKRKLLVDWHGAHRPTGQHRMYPNVVNYEGIHGLEVMKFYDGKEDFMDNDVKSFFVRMTAGPLDYTPGAMRNFPRNLPKGEKGPADFRVPGSFGTRCHQIALMSMFEAPLQMLCDSPTHYEQNQECFDFMAKTPVTWAKTVGLGGTPDTFAAIARQAHGGDWWVSAISNWEPRDFTLDTAFLGVGTWDAEIFRDAADCDREPTHYVRETRRVRAGEKLDLRLAPGGGFAIRFVPLPLRVAVYADKGVRSSGTYRHFQLNELAEGIEEIPVDAEMIRNGALDKADMLVMSGGSSVTIAKNLGEKGREAIRRFIWNGGSYFGTCAGACLLMESASHHPNMLGVIPYRTIGARGRADMMIRFNKDAERLTGIPAGRERVLYSLGPVLVPSKPVEGASFVTIATYDSYIDTDSVKRRETMLGKIAGVAGTYGKGKVLVYSVHPEYDYADHHLIRGAYRYLTGRDVKWEIPQRKPGQLAVGFLTDNSWSVETANLVRKLSHGDEFDVEPASAGEVRTGILRHLDVLVAPPGNEFAVMKKRYRRACKPLVEDFQKRGGMIVTWGEAAEVFRQFGGEVVEAKDAEDAVRTLRKIAARTHKPAPAISVPEYDGKKIRAAVYTDKGGANYNVLETFALSPEYDVTVVSAKDIQDGALENFDLLLQPGGGCHTQYMALGTNGAAQIERFVRSGGKYYGICAGAFLASQTCVPQKPRIGLVPFKDQNVGVYRGWGAVPVKMTEEGLKVFGHSITNRDVIYWGGPVLEPGEPVADSDVKVLATYDCDRFCTCSTNEIPSWAGAAAFVGGRVGKGKVFVSCPHPEKEVASFDIVYSALEYLTGVRPTQVPRFRRPGTRRTLFKTDKVPDVAALYAKKVLFDPRFDVTASAEFGDLSHYDTILMPSPHAKDFGPKLKRFAANGGTIYAVTNTPERAAAVKGVPYVTKVGSYDEIK